MLIKNSIFPNNQAQEKKIAGIYEDINPGFINLLRNDLVNPKPLMICGGGTSSMCAADGHWTLDLRRNFQEIKFDNVKKEISIEGGVSMQRLIEKTSEFNRSFPIGLSAETGIGYILTGGISPLSRKYGLAIDNILEISGIWGNGEKFKLFKPNEKGNKNEKLKWKGLCGAAPFLAIITSLRLQTQQLKPICGWETSLSSSQLAETIAMAEEWPNSASLYWIWGNNIKAYGVYELDTLEDFYTYQDLINQIPKTNDFITYNIENISRIRKLKDSGIINKSLNTQHSEVLGLLGPKTNNKISIMVKDIEKLIKSRPSESSFISSQQLGGLTMNKGIDSTSFIHRDSMWKPWITGSWDSGDIQGRQISLNWIEDSWEALKSFFPGVHLAQMHPHLKWHRQEINAAFKNWLPELKVLKSNYDPKGILPPL